MMEMTPLRRIVLVMLLVAIPWFMVVAFGFAFLVEAHQGEAMSYTFGMKVSIIGGGILCLLALAVCADAERKKQANPLLYLFALSAFWFLLEWPGKALLAILHS
jgi:hypothetical protein